MLRRSMAGRARPASRTTFYLHNWKVCGSLVTMDHLQQQLRTAERAAAAPFVDEPRSEGWYPLLMAAFVTALTAGPVMTLHGMGYLGFLLQGLAIGATAVYYVRHEKRAGAVPRMRSAPAEVRRAYAFLLVGAVVAVAVSVVAWLLGGWPVGLTAVFVSSLAVVWLYERRVYPRAVALVRDRLA